MVKPALKYDLERMAASNCRIGINGDVFDFILPSDLKRFDLDALDRELLQGGLKPIQLLCISFQDALRCLDKKSKL